MRPQNLIPKIIDSRLVAWVTNLPPLAWLIRTITHGVVRRKIERVGICPSEPANIVKAGLLDETLQHIVRDVVEALGYAGAMVATYEQGDALPVRAFYVDPSIADESQIHQWENEISSIAGREINMTNPEIARVLRYDPKHKNNLSVQAVAAQKPIVSDHLFSLFTPIAPAATQQIVRGIQQALGIKQVIAVPFFLETGNNGNVELLGNLFAAKRSQIEENDIRVLSAFARQAAAALEGERRRLQIQVAQEIVYAVQTNLLDEEQILQRIVKGIVDDLGYLAASVVSMETDQSPPLHSFYFEPQTTDEQQIRCWEATVSKIVQMELGSIRISIRQEAGKTLPTAKSAGFFGEPIIIDDIQSASSSVEGQHSKATLDSMQQALGIQCAIAAPMFLDTVDNGHQPELIGFLLAATRSREFSQGEIELLKVFSQQAAAGIRNARLYRHAKERREAAEIFAKMAFNAAQSVHELRNHIGFVQTNLDLLKMVEQLPSEQRREVSSRIGESTTNMAERLSQAAQLLSNLDQPWRLTPDVPTDVNACIKRALHQVLPEAITVENVQRSLQETLPRIYASPDMLSEVFRILLINSVEAIFEIKRDVSISIESHLNGAGIEVSISDNGVGIKSDNVAKIFDMKWSTKAFGMGFGLFWTKDYIEGLGGKIQVTSEWHKGTTFYISLPTS